MQHEIAETNFKLLAGGAPAAGLAVMNIEQR
jgi:hypothetical protein